MGVTLRVVGPNSQVLGNQSSKVFESGGTIGRSVQNDWVLPDPDSFISSHHAVIEVRGSDYYLSDTSINGTFVNSAEQPIGHGNSQLLVDGDQIRIGSYEISVSLVSNEIDAHSNVWPDQQNAPVPSPGVGGGLLDERSMDPLDHLGERDSPALGGGYEFSERAGLPPESESPDGFGNYSRPNVVHDPFAPRVEPLPPVEDHPGYAPPMNAPPPTQPGGGARSEGIPEDWDRTTMPPAPDQRLPPTPPQQAPPPSYPGPEQPPLEPGYENQIPPVAARGADQPQWQQPPPGQQTHPYQQAPSHRSDHGAPPPDQQPPQGQADPHSPGSIAELLEVAGLDQATARAVSTPENSHVLGLALQVVIQGMMEVLSARAELKNQFRVAMTQIHTVENNPLKFCVDSTDALRRLLIQEGSGFLGPVDAFTEAFEDVKAHQMAMMAGMRAAFDEVMRRFDPKNLQREFDRELRRAPMFQAKIKYWDMLTELYEELNRDSDANFGQLFGDEFSRAYEAQMDRLGGQRRP